VNELRTEKCREPLRWDLAVHEKVIEETPNLKHLMCSKSRIKSPTFLFSFIMRNETALGSIRWIARCNLQVRRIVQGMIRAKTHAVSHPCPYLSYPYPHSRRQSDHAHSFQFPATALHWGKNLVAGTPLHSTVYAGS
jgi:hypothetical protein